MLSAKEANIKAIKNKIQLNIKNFIIAKKEISSNLDKAISKGLTSMKYYSNCKEELKLIIDWLETLGYSTLDISDKCYFSYQYIIKIYWEEKT